MIWVESFDRDDELPLAHPVATEAHFIPRSTIGNCLQFDTVAVQKRLDYPSN
jgi:hypothetical protein